jgi:hypothetical protein
MSVEYDNLVKSIQQNDDEAGSNYIKYPYLSPNFELKYNHVFSLGKLY